MSAHQEESCKFILNTGLPPVPVKSGHKEPVNGWDKRNAELQDKAEVLRRFRKGEWGLGALFHGRWVDVDVDTFDRAFHTALDMLLPDSEAVWGRPSKRRSHRVYLLQQDFDRSEYSAALDVLKNKTGFPVEIRGGKIEAVMHCVLPGSTHVDGEQYEWDTPLNAGVSPVAYDVATLVKALRMAAVARIVSEHWVAPGRNELNLAFAGAVWRITQASTQGIKLEMEDLERMLTAITTISNDEEYAIRMLNARKTWEKLTNDNEARVTGGGKLKELIGAEATSLIYKLLSDDRDAEIMEEAASRFCILYGQGLLVDLEALKKGSEHAAMSKDQAVNSMGGQFVRFGDKEKPMANWLFSTPLVPRAAGFTSDPSSTNIFVHTPQGTKVNLWGGFATEPAPKPVSDEEVQPFINYMREIVCSGHDDRYEWMMDWLANLIQHPARKSKVGVVLIGKQGAGKTFLGTQIVRPMLGKHNVVQFGTMSGLVAKHNAMLQNKLWIQCDEAAVSQQRRAYTDIKALIDGETIMVEPKNVNAYELPFHGRIFITSNHEDAVKMDSDESERRFMYMAVSEVRHKDLEYWTMMHEWVPANLPRIMRWLKDRKYDFKRISRPVQTKEKALAQDNLIPLELDWLLSRIEEGHPLSPDHHVNWFDAMLDVETKRQEIDRTEWPGWINMEALGKDLFDFARARGETYKLGRSYQMVRKCIPFSEKVHRLRVNYVDPKTMARVKTRKWMQEMPTVGEIKKHIEKIYGAAVLRSLNEFEQRVAQSHSDDEDDMDQPSVSNVVKF